MTDPSITPVVPSYGQMLRTAGHVTRQKAVEDHRARQQAILGNVAMTDGLVVPYPGGCWATIACWICAKHEPRPWDCREVPHEHLDVEVEVDVVVAFLRGAEPACDLVSLSTPVTVQRTTTGSEIAMDVHLISWLLTFCLFTTLVHALPRPGDALAFSPVVTASATTTPSSPNLRPRQVAFVPDILTSTEGFWVVLSTRSVTVSTTVTSISTAYDVETQFTTFTTTGDTSTVTTTLTTTISAAGGRATISPRRPGPLGEPANERSGHLVYRRQAITITTYTSTKFVNGYTTEIINSTLATVTSTDLNLVTLPSTRVETILDTTRPLQLIAKTEFVTVTAEKAAESTTTSTTAAVTAPEMITSTSSSTPTTAPENTTSTTAAEITSNTGATSSDMTSSTRPAAGTTGSASAPTTTIIISTGQGQISSESSSSGLSREAQIGIGVGVGALMVVITLLGVACLLHRRKNRDQAFSHGGGPFDASVGEPQSNPAGPLASPLLHGRTRPELHGRSRSELHGETAMRSERVWSGGSWSTVTAAGGYAGGAVAAIDDGRRESGNGFQYSTSDGQWYPAVHGGASPPLPDKNGFVAREGGGYWHNRHGWHKGPAELHSQAKASELDVKS